MLKQYILQYISMFSAVANKTEETDGKQANFTLFDIFTLKAMHLHKHIDD